MSKFQQFCQLIGIHPFVGFTMFVIDWMLFVAEGTTFGGSWVISIGVAGVLTIPCILVQRYGCKDEWGLAIGKGLLIGCITAVPTALPSFMSAGLGVFGAFAPSKSNNNNDTDKQHPTLSE
jgi:hypothetical protein